MQFAESNWHSDRNPRATYEQAVAEPARIQWTLGDAWRVALFGRHNDCGAAKCVGSCRDPHGKVPRWDSCPGARPRLGKSRAGKTSGGREEEALRTGLSLGMRLID